MPECQIDILTGLDGANRTLDANPSIARWNANQTIFRCSYFLAGARDQSMKQLRVGLGVSIFYIAALAGSLPSQASILDIQIDNPSISVMLPATGIQEYFFTGSISNTSAFDLNFENLPDPITFQKVRGIDTPNLYAGPGFQQNPLTYTDPFSDTVTFGGLLQQPLFGACSFSSSCLRVGQTFTGAIASVMIGPDTVPGIYAVTQDGLGHPAAITFLGTYVQDGQLVSFTQGSAGLSVNVTSEHAVPEPRTWALLVAGLVGMMLLSSKRVRSKSFTTA